MSAAQQPVEWSILLLERVIPMVFAHMRYAGKAFDSGQERTHLESYSVHAP